MAALDQLINDLRADGSVDSEGRFTLDREQARAKMQKFQLVDARRYVLELVQAAVLRDATAIEFEIDADDMRMRFDGVPFGAAELDDLYGSLFTDGDSRALRGVRQLALALNAALGMGPKHIHMRSGEVELRMVPGKRDAIITHDEPAARTEIHVRQRLRMRTFVDFFLNLAGRIAEEQYLRERCLFSTVPVTLDGKPISYGLAGGESGLAKLEVSGEDFRGVLKLVDGAAQLELRLVKDGVWIDNRQPRDCGSNLIAVIEGENLRKDVSQAKIVESAALLRIDATLRRARWSLWKLAYEQLEGGEAERVWTMIAEQLLHFASREELEEVAEARALATQLRWRDCRGQGRRISLVDLLELALAGETLRYAQATYPELPADGAPIVLVQDPRELAALDRLLERELVEADDLLGREQRRLLGRRAWLERAGEATLPTHVRFAVTGAIVAKLDSGPVRGEVGVDVQLLTSPDLAAPVHLFMYKDGCLLGRAELELELPNLWLVIDAGFEPNLDHTDAVRDPAFITILLRSLAALREPFARLLSERAKDPNEALIRGLVKRWLIALVDRKSQVALLTRAGVDVAPKFFVPTAELLPDLSGGQLLRGEAETDPLATVPMFEAQVGPRLSLAQLAALINANGKLLYTESRPEDPRLKAPGVVFLGPGDRKIVRALFGDGRLDKWDPSANRQRELEFWYSPRKDLSSMRAELMRGLGRSGVVTERWVVDLPEQGARGFVVWAYDGGPSEDRDELDELDGVRLSVRHEGRKLCELELEGPGPIDAVVEHPGLRAAASWDDVVRDAAFDEVIAAVRAASRELVRRSCIRFERETVVGRRWLARVLLHAAAEHPPLRELIDDVPLLSTVAGNSFSLARAAGWVREHGKLEVVGTDAGWAPFDDPPVIVVDEPQRDELASLLGDVLEDASARVRHHRVFAQLEGRPALREAKLDPNEVLVSVEIQGNGQVGEVGLASRREQPGLSLELGLAGREVGRLFVESGLSVAVEAVVIDDELPLDAQGKVEAKSKRVRGLVRQCRRRVPGLMKMVCERWPELSGEQRELAWRLLVRHLQSEAGQDRRRSREQAWEAATAVPGFREVCGRRMGLAQILAESRPRSVDVLSSPRYAHLRVDLPELDRPIVIVDELELDCLRAYAEVRELDEVWEDELAQIRALASAPKVETPEIHDVALVYRKAMVAGGLECELWLTRAGSVFEAPPELVFARGGRELGRGIVSELLPCAGIVRGEGLTCWGGAVELEDRQVSSLERQQVILYVELAKLVADDRIEKYDRDRAFELLAWAAVGFERHADGLRGHGKHGIALRKAVDEIVPPSLRAALRRRLDRQSEPEPEPEPEPQAPPEPQVAAPASTPKSIAVDRSEPAPVVAAPSTPEQRLLAAIYEQLHWARARHDLLDELLLDSMRISSWGAGEIAGVDRHLLALNRDHPIVARVLGQDPHDPIDLSFLVAALYSLLNYEAEEIRDEHEREFVGQFAEALALAARAQRGP